ncbi:MAG: PucR family transcriptional regulator [Actinomycetota bacterium]|nr:PucR family transcriptional regulator [Actinomycetota bacterium]
MSSNDAAVGFTLARLLELPVLDGVDPQVVHGAERLASEVRWVHTSEIYDIGPLLKGGEALLTSGLGIVGVSDTLIRRYVRSLEAAGITALLFEVGRTFNDVPRALREEIERTDVALVVLHGVKPFIEITEAAHRILVASESEHLRVADRVTTALLHVLVSSGGMRGLLDTLARLLGMPVTLISGDGRVVASTSALRSGTPLHDVPPGDEENIEIYGNLWGTVRCHGNLDAAGRLALRRAATAISLEMVRSGEALPARRNAQRSFITYVMAEEDGDSADLSSRAASLGLVVPAGGGLAAIGLRPERELGDSEAVARAVPAVQRTFGRAIIGTLDGIVVALVALDVRQFANLERLCSRLLVDQDAAGRSARLFLQVCLSNPVEDWPGVRGALRSVLEGFDVARRVQLEDPVLVPARTALLRLLLTADPGAVDAYIREQIGRVIDYDATTGAELMRTLEVLASGRTRSAAAEVLGISRQTLYARLDRIAEVTGGRHADEPDHLLSMQVALLAWRLRTQSASAPQWRHR